MQPLSKCNPNFDWISIAIHTGVPLAVTHAINYGSINLHESVRTFRYTNMK